MPISFDEARATLAAAPQPAWLWDIARRRIVLANGLALSFWGESALENLVERRFGADDPAVAAMAVPGPFDLPDARAEGAGAVLRDGRPGMLVTVVGKAEATAVGADLFMSAPTALVAFDAKGRRLRANGEAEELLVPGDLGIVLSSPYLADEILAAVGRTGMATRTMPVATRFGLRRCRIIARRSGDGPDARILLAIDDVEDRLALEAAPVDPAPVAPPAPPPPLSAPAALPEASAIPTEPPPPEPVPAAAPIPPVAAAPPLPPSAALDEVVAALAEPTLAADADGHVITMNAKAARLLGESARGEPLLNMLPPDLKADAAAYIASDGARGLERALEDGRETRISSGSNDDVPVRVSFARLGTGEILVRFFDLTSQRASDDELKRARAEAEEASQHKTEFLASISHELRTPLNAIIGFAEMMEQQRLGPIENPKYRGYVHDIKDSGELLLSLINDLLDLSKAESGRIELDPDAVEIRPIVMSVLSLLGPQADRYGVVLRASVPSDIPAIVADQRSLRQILLNLAGNAIKYNREGGEVEVAATMDAAGAVHIVVRDTGHGMDADELKNAMEPYRRTKSGRGREGTGLGLPLARALIEANKAQFTMDSTPGKGTEMRLTFPSTLVLAG